MFFYINRQNNEQNQIIKRKIYYIPIVIACAEKAIT